MSKKSNKPKASKAKALKCPWCSKQTYLTPKGGLRPHVDAGGKRCTGIGINPAPLVKLLQANGKN